MSLYKGGQQFTGRPGVEVVALRAAGAQRRRLGRERRKAYRGAAGVDGQHGHADPLWLVGVNGECPFALKAIELSRSPGAGAARPARSGAASVAMAGPG